MPLLMLLMVPNSLCCIINAVFWQLTESSEHFGLIQLESFSELYWLLLKLIADERSQGGRVDVFITLPAPEWLTRCCSSSASSDVRLSSDLDESSDRLFSAS